MTNVAGGAAAETSTAGAAVVAAAGVATGTHQRPPGARLRQFSALSCVHFRVYLSTEIQ